MDLFSEMAEQYAEQLGSRMHLQMDREVAHTMHNEGYILRFLKRHGAAHPKELSDLLMVSTARMAVILNGLERKGLIARSRDAADNRQKTVVITEAGSATLEQRYRHLLTFFAESFRELGEEDAREFLRLNEKLARIAAAQIAHNG